MFYVEIKSSQQFAEACITFKTVLKIKNIQIIHMLKEAQSFGEKNCTY